MAIALTIALGLAGCSADPGPARDGVSAKTSAAVPDRGSGGRDTASAPRGEPALPDDFNGDGIRDLAIGDTGAGAGGVAEAGAVAVLTGFGAGAGAVSPSRLTWNDSGTEARPQDWFGSVMTSADFNGDGYADLAVAAIGRDEPSDEDVGGVTVTMGGPSGLTASAPAARLDIPAERRTHKGSLMASGDVDADGFPDLIVGDSTWTFHVVHGGPTFPAGAQAWPFDLGEERGDLVVADVTGDKVADVVTLLGDRVEVRAGGREGLAVPVVTPLDRRGRGYQVHRITVGDVDTDGKPDIVVSGLRGPDAGKYYRGEITVFHGGSVRRTVLDGKTPGMEPFKTRPTGFARMSTAVTDIDGDHDTDLVVTLPDSDAFLLVRSGRGGLTPSTGTLAGGGRNESRTVKLIDLDGDGRTELVTSGQVTGKVTVSTWSKGWKSSLELGPGENGLSGTAPEKAVEEPVWVFFSSWLTFTV
ncbi:hypothetical protein FHS43_006634 [Streptosporangium becharense]|uniref:VCBS repeat-containing protein n=1 Tax=Streptosporangium becharense TaxID=1816182 RepID=A0A7W9ME89_9ACTN|nr:FG-GAP-like repeat-containing protein [Streptosporangium becharense]MBB2915314.1 hypothetical protein [Streptosporangium becharense]MBB5816988.1 hypothetical protein [Streptosporangium becharense]